MSAHRNAIDALFNAKWDDVVAAQEAHANGGSYCQLLGTTDEVPEDGQAIVPDKLTRKARGESKSWTDFPGILPPTLRSRLECHNYFTGTAHGFVVVVTVKEGNDLWQRRLNHGPETWREMPWTMVKPG